VIEVLDEEPGARSRPAAGDGRCGACGRVAGYRVIIQ
jgi:hypothetical protein